MSDDFVQLNLRDLELIPDDDAMLVRFVRDGYNAAKPRAKPLYADIFTLLKSEWGQLIYNGRYTCSASGNWWYQQSVYNIGWLSTNDANSFTRTAPSHEFSELAHLR